MQFPPGLLDRVVAIVPVRSLETAKSRLGGPLDAEERQALVRELLERTLRAATEAAGISRVFVVSDDRALLELARSFGAVALREAASGLNRALGQGRAEAVAFGASAVLALPADLPQVSPGTIDGLLEAARDAVRAAPAGRILVVLVPDRHGEGTNALLLAPPDAIAFAFGPGSRRRHARLAEAAGALLLELSGPLSLDLDTPEDLLLAGR